MASSSGSRLPTEEPSPSSQAIDVANPSSAAITDGPSGVEGEKKKLNPCAYCLYYMLLFFAYWFGAKQFDVDGDGDFDPEDVQAFLQNTGLIQKNFKVPKKEAERRLKKGKAGGSTKNIDQTPKKPAAPAEQEASIFDQNGDGQVDFRDVLESAVSGDAVEDEVMDELRQSLPWFVIIENFLAFSLWLFWDFWISFVDKDPNDQVDFLAHKAGLDSFWNWSALGLDEGWSDLRIFGPACEDYRAQVWRYLTYQWTHIGITHVVMNVILNTVLGVPLEGLHGFKRMCLMYNIGVFGGALCYFVNDSHTTVVGMSGGCYALIGMHLADLVMNWAQKKFRKPILLFLIVLVGIDFMSYFLALSSENSSHSAHLGGAIAGCMIGILIGKNLKVKTWERVLQVMILVLGVGLVTACLVWMIINDSPRNIWEMSEEGWCWTRQVFDRAVYGEKWVCVSCGDETCIAGFQAQYTNLDLKTVKNSECTEWFRS